MGDWDEKTMRVPSPEGHVEPETDLSSLGNLLRLHSPHLTRSQLQEALAYQRDHPGIKLGEAMVALGLVDEKTVSQACQDQELLRRSKPSDKRSALIMREADKAQRQVGELDDAIDRFTDMIQRIAKKITK